MTGIAVHSTVGEVKRALLRARPHGVQRCIVASVVYVNAEVGAPPFLKKDNVFFPHLLKSSEFEYEEEIRFILRANYGLLKMQSGVMIKIDPLTIFNPKNVRVSPQLRQQEQEVVRELILALGTPPVIKKARSKRLGEPWRQLYKDKSKWPFPAQDVTPGAFKDLD